MSMVQQFLAASIWTLCWVVALFFFKFWRKSGDSLFLWFSAAFALLGIERLVALFGNQAEFEGYVIRLCAFVLILIGIGQKNRGAKR